MTNCCREQKVFWVANKKSFGGEFHPSDDYAYREYLCNGWSSRLEFRWLVRPFVHAPYDVDDGDQVRQRARNHGANRTSNAVPSTIVYCIFRCHILEALRNDTAICHAHFVVCFGMNLSGVAAISFHVPSRVSFRPIPSGVLAPARPIHRSDRH